MAGYNDGEPVQCWNESNSDEKNGRLAPWPRRHMGTASSQQEREK